MTCSLESWFNSEVHMLIIVNVPGLAQEPSSRVATHTLYKHFMKFVTFMCFSSFSSCCLSVNIGIPSSTRQHIVQGCSVSRQFIYLFSNNAKPDPNIIQEAFSCVA